MRCAGMSAAICVLAMSFSVAGEPITTGSLVNEMIDMHSLAEFPAPAFKTTQFSSFDHRSTVPGGPGWMANSDGFGHEPIPNFEEVIRLPDGDKPGEYVICDVTGPGAMVRTWTAAIGGEIRLFLDGSDTPVYSGSAEEFLLRPYKTFLDGAGLDAGILEGTFKQRNACYFPIPFAKRCRMVWIGDHKHIHFYQVQIRTYEDNTEVKTFEPADLKTYADDIKSVAGTLADIDNAWPYKSGADPTPVKVSVPGGSTETLFELEGNKAIEQLTLRLEADDLDRALRQTILHITFDGHPWGQVQCPVGDFFGAAPGINPYDSVPFTVRADGSMTCRYVMPFKQSCKIVLENKGKQTVVVTGAVLSLGHKWDDERSMHFRARWRVDHDLVASGGDAAQDMPYLVAFGQGVYVGTTTILLNTNDVPSCGGSWWGEGDEKIFVDDDQRPSTFGTGSEDYYNYAWSSPDIFLHPYCGQPRNDGPANRGFVTNNRWHILDPLPFKQRCAFYMELFHHERTPGVSYARTAYHYGRPGIMDDHIAITSEDVRHLRLASNWQPASRGAARNSTFYPAEQVVKGSPKVEMVKADLYAGSEVMVWKPEQVGAEITFEVPLEETRNWEIHLVAALTPESGKMSVKVNDKPVMGGEEGVIDLSRPYRTLLRRFGSGKIAMEKGKATVTIRYEGPGINGGSDIGIDFVWVQKRG